jgi:hypothetical protein
MATYLQLKNRVQQMALEADATEAGLFVNDVYKDLVIQTQANPTASTYTLNPGDTQVLFTGVSDSVVIMYVLYKAVGETLNQVLEPTTFEEILNLNASQPTGFIRKYAVIGTGDFSSLQMYPAAQSTGDTITVWMAAPPAPLVSDSVTPIAIPTQWQYLISVGAAARLIQAVGEDEALATAFEQKYDAGVIKFKQWLGRREGNSTQRMSVGYLFNQRPMPHDNSRDVRWSNG